MKSGRTTILKTLKKKMNEASTEFLYERAAEYRDQIRLIEKLDSRGSLQENLQPEVFASDPSEALLRLQKRLKRTNTIRVIEGIDIAHLAGNAAVGSLVKFIDGRPFKNGYRKFRIKSVSGIDDYAMISEVVRRRYKYALKGEELWPDVILIDGGKGQLSSAQQALQQLMSEYSQEGTKPPEENQPLIVSLAKRDELIYVAGREKFIKLPRTSPALKLLQYVRDEAHRFAQHYHHLLRGKDIYK